MSITQPNSAKISHPQPLSNSDKDFSLSNDSAAEIEGKGLGKYLGIDYGESKVGLALADTETKIAYAFETLDNNKDLLQKIAEIIAQENVVKIIIGIPSYINKDEVIYAGERLGKIINKATGVEVEYQNEMFTTKMAQANLIEKGVKGIKKFDDQEAARIILQEWLDKI